MTRVRIILEIDVRNTTRIDAHEIVNHFAKMDMLANLPHTCEAVYLASEIVDTEIIIRNRD